MTKTPPTRTEAQRKRLANQIKDEQALSLRLAGLNYIQIAIRLGYVTPNGASAAVKRALLRHPNDEDIEQLRRLSAMRIDQAIVGISGRVGRGDLQSIDRLIALETYKTKLLGLQVEVEKQSKTTVDITERHEYDKLSDGERIKLIDGIMERARERLNAPRNERLALPDPTVVSVQGEILE